MADPTTSEPKRDELHLMYCLESIARDNQPSRFGMPITFGGNLYSFMMMAPPQATLLMAGLDRVKISEDYILKKVSEIGMILELNPEEMKSPGLAQYNGKLVKRLVYVKE